MRSNEDALRRGGGRQDHQRCLQQRCNMERRLNAKVLEVTDLSESLYVMPPLRADTTPEAYLGDIIARYTGQGGNTDREEED